MLSTADPGDVVRAVAAGVSRLVTGELGAEERERQLDALADLYGERTDVRHPLAPLGDHPLRSRADLRAHFVGAIDHLPVFRRFGPTNMVVHRTADPEVVIAEFAYTGTVGTIADDEFAVPNIFVVRVRDGVIVESRDYAGHIAMARATGQLGSLARALAADADPAPGEPPNTQVSRDLALRMHQVFNALDLPAVDEIFAPDFYSHPLRFRGPDGVRQRWLTMRTAAPDLRTEVINVMAEDDHAMIHSRLNDGTGELGAGELFEVIRVADGRIAELWGARTIPDAQRPADAEASSPR
jgi:ketosteroid isomerase-like protein